MPDSLTNADAIIDSTLRLHLPSLSADERIPDDVSLTDLGLDSLGAVNLVLDLEVALGIELPDEILVEDTFRSSASLHDTLRQYIATNALDCTTDA